MNILLIEDDPALNMNIEESLRAEKYNVEIVFDGQIAIKLLKKNQYDCVILDINLPLINGYEVAKQFRMINKTTPILMLTAFGELEDKIQGYESGADDYLTKPFYMKELLLRVNSLIKRTGVDLKESDASIEFGTIVINKSQQKVFRNDKEITLTFREYQVLLMLMENKGEVVSKRKMLQQIWGHSFNGDSNTIEVYINFLRNKLDKPFGKSTIKTKVGYGYYLATDEN